MLKMRDESAMADPSVKDEIISLLNSSSLTVSDIKRVLFLDWPAKKFKAYLAEIPNIRTKANR